MLARNLRADAHWHATRNVLVNSSGRILVPPGPCPVTPGLELERADFEPTVVHNAILPGLVYRRTQS